MNSEDKLKNLSKSELKKTNGGAILATAAAIAGIYAGILAGAAALGYANGREDCK